MKVKETVSLRGTYFLYHTCINTCVDRNAPPDGYFQNRICVALSDKVSGPFRPIGKPVIQDLSCNPGKHTGLSCGKEVGAYLLRSILV
jgi:hypothetical protein